MGPIALIVLTIAAIAFSAGGILAGRLFNKGSKNNQKGQPYEEGDNFVFNSIIYR